MLVTKKAKTVTNIFKLSPLPRKSTFAQFKKGSLVKKTQNRSHRTNTYLLEKAAMTLKRIKLIVSTSLVHL